MTITRKIKVHTVIFFLSVFLIPFLLSACQEKENPTIVEKELPIQKERTPVDKGNFAYPGEINTSCTVDSDCALSSPSRCFPHCQQAPYIGVNKETAEKIKAWQKEKGNEGCSIGSCVYPVFVRQSPVCINSACTSRKELHCQTVCAELNYPKYETSVNEITEIIEAEGLQVEQCSCK